MEIKDVTPDLFADIFGGAGTNLPAAASSADGSTTAIDQTTQSASAGDTTTVAVASAGDTTTKAPDIFSDTSNKGGEGKKAKPVEGLEAYFQERIKNKKFVALKEVDEEGNESLFIPKTAEEFDQVFDLQVDYQIDKKKKELEQGWYQAKSPAWQVVARYADLLDNPSQLIPFLEGVRTIESVQEIDENTPEGAEAIVRTRMERNGEPKEIIDQQIDLLKGANKLVETGKQYKPLVIREEQQSMLQQKQEAEQRERDWTQSIVEVENAAIKAIESPIFGNQKLTKEEKAIVYDMIAFPSEETQGYGIYSEIDKLFEKRDPESMETLRQVALLLGKKEAFFTYAGTSVANRTAAGAMKKIKVADSMSSSSNNSGDPDDQPIVVKKNNFNNKVRFGSF